MLSEEKALTLLAEGGVSVIPHVCVTAEEDIPSTYLAAKHVICRPIHGPVEVVTKDVRTHVQRLIGKKTAQGDVVSKVLLYPHFEGISETVTAAIDWQKKAVVWSAPVSQEMKQSFVAMDGLEGTFELICGMVHRAEVRMDPHTRQTHLLPYVSKRRSSVEVLIDEGGKIGCLAMGRGQTEAWIASFNHFGEELGFAAALHYTTHADNLREMVQCINYLPQKVIVLDLAGEGSARLRAAIFAEALFLMRRRKRILIRLAGPFQEQACSWLLRRYPGLCVYTDAKECVRQAILKAGLL